MYTTFGSENSGSVYYFRDRTPWKWILFSDLKALEVYTTFGSENLSWLSWFVIGVYCFCCYRRVKLFCYRRVLLFCGHKHKLFHFTRFSRKSIFFIFQAPARLLVGHSSGPLVWLQPAAKMIFDFWCFSIEIWFCGFTENSEGGVRLGMFFLCRMVVELWRNSVLGSIYDGFGVSKMLLVCNWCFWKDLFNFATMNPHRSALGSPSKAS